MWKPEHRLAADRRGLSYPSDLTDAEWAIVAAMIPGAIDGRSGGVNNPKVCNIAQPCRSRCRRELKGRQKEKPPPERGSEFVAFDHCCLRLLSAGGDDRSADAGTGGAGGVAAGTVRVEVARVVMVPPTTASRMRYCVRSPSLALQEVIVPPPNAGWEVPPPVWWPAQEPQ